MISKSSLEGSFVFWMQLNQTMIKHSLYNYSTHINTHFLVQSVISDSAQLYQGN